MESTNIILINPTGLTVMDLRSTEPSRLCNYDLVLIFYISPNICIFIISLNINIVNSNYLYKQTRRKYDLYKRKVAKYQFMLYKIGFLGYFPNVYSNDQFTRKVIITESGYHCNYFSIKELLKKPIKINIIKFINRNE